MARRAFNLLTVASLLLFVAVVVLWVRRNAAVEKMLDDAYSVVSPNPGAYPLVACLAGIAPAAWGVSKWRDIRRERRARRGQCLGCGYDLRATTGRCPECGAENSAVALM